jgi:hypothetical protein
MYSLGFHLVISMSLHLSMISPLRYCMSIMIQVHLDAMHHLSNLGFDCTARQVP